MLFSCLYLNAYSAFSFCKNGSSFSNFFSQMCSDEFSIAAMTSQYWRVSPPIEYSPIEE